MVLKSYQNPILAGFSYNITHFFRWYPRSTPNLESRSLVCIHFRHSPRKTFSYNKDSVTCKIKLQFSWAWPVENCFLCHFLVRWNVAIERFKVALCAKILQKIYNLDVAPNQFASPYKTLHSCQCGWLQMGGTCWTFPNIKSLVCTGDISIEAHIRTICFFLCLYISSSSRFNPNNDCYLAHDLPRVGKDTQKKHRGWVSHDHPKSISFNQPTIILIESIIISWKNMIILW